MMLLPMAAIIFNRTRQEAFTNNEDQSSSDDSKSSNGEEEEKTPPTTVIIIEILNKKTERKEQFRALLDSGSNRCIGTKAAILRAGLKCKTAREHKYKTAAGTFSTTLKAKIRAHNLLELNSRRILQNLQVQVSDKELGIYDFIFGRDYMKRYGIDLLFSEGVIQWDGMRMTMKEPKDLLAMPRMEMENVEDEINFAEHDLRYDEWEVHTAQQILESKYEKQDLLRVAKDQSHLTKEQQELLHKVLAKYEDLFRGTLGEWPDEEISVELTPDAVPYHCGKPIRIPHVHLETLKKEVQRLVEIGVLEVVDGAKAGPWCAPSFIIPKKDGRVRFITDYRELNKRIRRKPWPMPHIMDLIQDVGSYRYVTALDLSMGYYHFKLDKELSDMSTFMLPFGLFKYTRLPMGLSISPDFFQERMAKLFGDLPWIKVFLDDLLIFSNGTFEDHMEKVSTALERLHAKNLAVNALKSYWAVEEVDYLGFRLTRQGVMPQERKVKAIMEMTPPTNKRSLRRFIGMVNYYRFMWRHRSQILAPLSSLSGANSPFKWTEVHQKAFEEMKRIVSQEVLLSFPDYTQPFEIYTDASDKQMGAILKQGDKTLAFFSKKLNPAQQNYGVGEKEMLSVVEALKEFRTMIYGYPIKVYTDHQNWTYDKAFRNARVMRWRLLIQEYAPTLIYIKGEKNVVADALSRLDFDKRSDNDTLTMVEEVMDVTPWRRFWQPITIGAIGQAQKKDKYLQTLQRQAPDRLGEFFEDIGKKSGPDRVITEQDLHDNQSRIIVPASLRKRLVEWYHTNLIHPGVHRLYNTLHQHYTWPKMMEDIRQYIRNCGPCQKAKRGLKGYGKLSKKDTETQPWKDVAVDLSGPWKAIIDNQEVIFHTLTIIDVFTGWVEIIPISTKNSSYISDLFVREWLRRYPRPSRVIFDLGGEFDSQAFQSMLYIWHVKPEPITVKNPRANAVVERMHSVLGDMLRVQLASRHEKEDAVQDLTSAAAYAIRATVHGVTKYTPSQLVFSKDMILRTNMQAKVELVRQRREAAIQQNNARENKRRIAYDYKVGDRILILSNSMDPKLQLHKGPFNVVGFNKASGTLHIQRRNYIEPINIRLVRPYFGNG
jgi:RNase H-like domain found in reverse transcriptase/Integrase zinc binding domain/Reverse transcriptase (RNA-dependent DNA polymerase)